MIILRESEVFSFAQMKQLRDSRPFSLDKSEKTESKNRDALALWFFVSTLPQVSQDTQGSKLLSMVVEKVIVERRGYPAAYLKDQQRWSLDQFASNSVSDPTIGSSYVFIEPDEGKKLVVGKVVGMDEKEVQLGDMLTVNYDEKDSHFISGKKIGTTVGRLEFIPRNYHVVPFDEKAKYKILRQRSDEYMQISTYNQPNQLVFQDYVDYEMSFLEYFA